ncbi:hypothetical protein J6590_082991 [Homalodisca vitripennis]|nr:hypothetical protein J6590_082991 [Homalodisca vitripennis]
MPFRIGYNLGITRVPHAIVKELEDARVTFPETLEADLGAHRNVKEPATTNTRIRILSSADGAGQRYARRLLFQ